MNKSDAVEIHSILSEIEVEFSLTGLTRCWREAPVLAEWDARCKSLDLKVRKAEILAKTNHIEDVDQSFDLMIDKMNNIWGAWRSFLNRLAEGDEVDHNTVGFSDAHETSKIIQKHIEDLKYALDKHLGNGVG